MFRNETKEWYHVFVDGKNPLQKQAFYTVGESFVKAEDLKISDKLLLSSRKCVTIEEIQVEQLSKPETTYNFEVADFHTYYVSESNVLVHNKCAYKYLDEALERQGLDKVPEGGLKERWVENGYNIEVRVHAGESKYTSAKQIFRVSRQKIVPAGMKGAGVEYLGSNRIWYHTSYLKPTNPLYDPVAAMITHIPVP